MTMRPLALLIFLTTDGVMQAPREPDEDRSGGFRRGGWANDCWDEVMQQVGANAMATPYDLLLGRRTYELFARSQAGDAKTPMGQATKYVVTSSPETLAWTGSQALTGDVAQSVARLKAEDGPLLQVHGSWQLCQTLLREDLVDLYRLWTFPVVVGEGKRLFANGAAPGNLELIDAASTPGGAIMSLYRRRNPTEDSSRPPETAA